MSDVSGVNIDAIDRLLLTAIHGTDEAAGAALAAWSQAADIMNVDSASFRLLPRLYLRTVSLAGSEGPLPQLRSTYRQFFYRNNLHVQQAAALLTKLSQITRDIIVTGDAPLVLKWHDDVGSRPLDCLRLVVEPDAHETVCEFLARELQLSPVNRLPLWARGLQGARSYAGENGLRIDVLRHFSTYGYSRDMDRDFRRRAIPFRIEDVETRTPSSTDQLLLSLIESSPIEGRPSLDWASDAAALLRKGAASESAEGVASMVASYQVTVPIRARLFELEAVLKSIVPEALIRELRSAQPSVHEEQEFALRTGKLSISHTYRWHRHFFNLRYSDAMGYVRYLQLAYEASSPFVIPLIFAKRRLRRIIGSRQTLHGLQ